MLPLDLPLIIEWLKGHKSAGVPLFQFSLEPSPSVAEGPFLVDAFTKALSSSSGYCHFLFLLELPHIRMELSCFIVVIVVVV